MQVHHSLKNGCLNSAALLVSIISWETSVASHSLNLSMLHRLESEPLAPLEKERFTNTISLGYAARGILALDVRWVQSKQDLSLDRVSLKINAVKIKKRNWLVGIPFGINSFTQKKIFGLTTNFYKTESWDV